LSSTSPRVRRARRRKTYNPASARLPGARRLSGGGLGNPSRPPPLCCGVAVVRALRTVSAGQMLRHPVGHGGRYTAFPATRGGRPAMRPPGSLPMSGSGTPAPSTGRRCRRPVLLPPSAGRRCGCRRRDVHPRSGHRSTNGARLSPAQPMLIQLGRQYCDPHHARRPAPAGRCPRRPCRRLLCFVPGNNVGAEPVSRANTAREDDVGDGHHRL
jgi:hypothetical protein